MQLIGMLDSPYVRRVAISLQWLGLPFAHRSVSVFRGYAEFHAVNPVVKAPTLVCDDGTVLMDSGLIIDYAEALAGRSLMPADLAERRAALRSLGLSLAACEKAVQIVYEHNIRPAEKLHEPWLARVTGQMQAALRALEAECGRRPPSAEAPDQAALTAAVVWHFIQALVPASAPAAEYPLLAAWSARAEALPAFAAAPHGDGTYPVTA
jgi:glutathione S-transferase